MYFILCLSSLYYIRVMMRRAPQAENRMKALAFAFVCGYTVLVVAWEQSILSMSPALFLTLFCFYVSFFSPIFPIPLFLFPPLTLLLTSFHLISIFPSISLTSSIYFGHFPLSNLSFLSLCPTFSSSSRPQSSHGHAWPRAVRRKGQRHRQVR